MNTKAFTGGAGTGKTTRLLRELDACLSAQPLAVGQRVLALTFMHGARHRLSERLASSSAKRHHECMTLDRFAWGICRRWRSRLAAVGRGAFLNFDEPDYDATCEAAGRLLATPEVANWIAARYPVIILDEFQDCAPVRLALARHLHGRVTMLIAADDFQNLSRTDECPGIVWLRELGIVEELSVNRRTAEAGLIAAAQALRSGTAVPTTGGAGFKLISAPSPDVAASFVSQTIAPAYGNDAVILSASRRGNSPWVERVVQLVQSRKYGKQKAGPVEIRWEAATESVAESTVAALGITTGSAAVPAAALLALPAGPVARALGQWVEHQRRVMGRSEFGASEVRAQVKRAVQHIRSLGPTTQAGRRVMTIHQAKNREFAMVIVLWPFEVVGDAVLARRWLYNAVTRARRRAVVIVQDPQKSRVDAPPFGASSPAAAGLTGAAATLPAPGSWSRRARARRCD